MGGIKSIGRKGVQGRRSIGNTIINSSICDMYSVIIIINSLTDVYI